MATQITYDSNHIATVRETSPAWRVIIYRGMTYRTHVHASRVWVGDDYTSLHVYRYTSVSRDRYGIDGNKQMFTAKHVNTHGGSNDVPMPNRVLHRGLYFEAPPF